MSSGGGRDRNQVAGWEAGACDFGTRETISRCPPERLDGHAVLASVPPPLIFLYKRPRMSLRMLVLVLRHKNYFPREEVHCLNPRDCVVRCS